MNLINLNINSISLSHIDEGNNYYFKTLTGFQIVLRGYMYAGCKENHFHSLPSGQAEASIFILLAQTSFQLAPKTFWWAEFISQFFYYWNFSKNITCLSGKLRTEFTSPIAKSTSPGLLDTAFFARCVCHEDTGVLSHFYSQVIT